MVISSLCYHSNMHQRKEINLVINYRQIRISLSNFLYYNTEKYYIDDFTADNFTTI